MESFVITIGREFGSLGRQIGLRTAELLGIAYYDRDIVEEVAHRMNMPLQTISREEETAGSKFGRLSKCLFPLGSGELVLRDKIFSVQECVLNDFADAGPCILVGRCADYVMRRRPRLMKIYIYAPLAVRTQNAMRLMNVGEVDARRMCLDVDRARSAYHRRYSGYDVMDPEQFHLMIDSSLLGVEGTAQLLAHLIREKFMKE